MLPSATKLWKGNVFTPVCQPFCSQGGCLPQCMLGYTLSRPGPPPADGHCSGRYASYWNAILLPPANEVWGKVICLQVCVCPQGGVPDQVPPKDQVHPPMSRHPPNGAEIPHPTPQEQTPPWDQVPHWEQTTPLEQTPPLAKCMLGNTVNARAVRILLECNLVELIVSFFFMHHLLLLQWKRFKPKIILCGSLG